MTKLRKKLSVAKRICFCPTLAAVPTVAWPCKAVFSSEAEYDQSVASVVARIHSG